MLKSKKSIIDIIFSTIVLIIFYVGLTVVTKYVVISVEDQIKNDRIETLDNFAEILNNTIGIDREMMNELKSMNTNISSSVAETIERKINEVETFDFFEEDILNVLIFEKQEEHLYKLIYFRKTLDQEERTLDVESIVSSKEGRLFDNYFAAYSPIMHNDEVIGYLIGIAGRENYNVWLDRGNIITKIVLGLFGLLLIYFFLGNVIKLNRLQYRDNLTGLVSKKYYKRIINKLIDRAPNINGDLYIIGFRDLYDFEAPNTDVIEEIVVRFANILKKYKAKTAFAFRVSERKLGLYVHGAKITDHILERLLGDVEQLLRSKRSYQNIQYYMGIAQYPLHEKDVDALVNGAIYALDNLRKGKKQYHIKNYQYYDPTSRKEFVDKQYLYDEVEKIINERRVFSVFQAIVDVNTGKIFGYEALSRPISDLVPNIGMLISLAAEMGISEDLELLLLFVINKTVMELKDNLGDRNLFVNTNVSVKYGDKELNKFKNTIDKITDNLVVEITEYDEIDFETITDKINAIKEFGAKIAIDDFGSGYSNELALLSLKPDIVKIDIALVRNIDTDQRKYQIVENLVKYAKNNDIKTLAEGVETSNELKIIKELGIDYVQGFIFSKPDKIMLQKEFNVDEYIKKEIV